MTETRIVRAPPRALAPVASTAEARAQVIAAREKLLSRLEAVEQTVEPIARKLEPIAQWREVVRRHPVLTIGGAFVVGYALARLFSRK